MPGFQPFLISEFKTGLFNYLEPWIRPQDAFEPLQNAFVYRGTLQKRPGYSIFGNIEYEDTIASGNGGKTYSGTLLVHPIYPGSFTPTNGVESFTDNGLGVLTGSAGGTGTINYTTGAWTLTFNANVTSGVAILAPYQPNTSRPIMGIKTWTSEADGSKKLVIFDTRRASVYNTGTNSFNAINTISQVLWVGDNTTTSISFTTGWAAIAPYANVFAPFSVAITDGISIITDTGSGSLTSSGNFAAGGTVNYATGVIALNFTAATTKTITLTVTLTGDYFSGTSANFFNTTNWIAPFYIPVNPGYLYITNNADPITTFDGTNLARPPFYITVAHGITFTNDIARALDVDVYKNRLLVERPTLIGSANPSFQSIRFSAINSPTNLAADVPGNGGEESAPTDDMMQSSEFLRDQFIVFFANSTWLFRFTGTQFQPFVWQKINSTKSTNAPYGTIPYDERITSMGAKGLLACDGVNVQRYDLSIIDQFILIDQQAFAQCYGIRFDSINQSWMLYPSDGTQTFLSDSILVYNFLENTWSTYTIPLSCLGIYFVTSDVIWNNFAVGQPLGDIYPNWNSAEFPWDNFLLQKLAPDLLGGALTGGFIYLMNEFGSVYDHPLSNDPAVLDSQVPIIASITTTRWNPFTKIGQKVQFGYIDFYYQIDPESATPSPATLTLTFMTDNTSATTATRIITLDGPVNSDVAMKRVYINNIGEFLRMNITSSSPAEFKIVGMILWARPAGRFTP